MTKKAKNIIILGIESSCDDTSAAVVKDGVLLSNVIAGQEVHAKYGGVVPELASRAHQQNIVPVVDAALHNAKVSKDRLSAVAFTRGPGLMGALLVGTSFAKGLALARKVPLIGVHHIHGHILARFIREKNAGYDPPSFPFICLVVSGGHTQLVLVKDHFDFIVLGSTIDDAAGEAFDKCAKVIGLPYPGGPEINRLASKGDPLAFHFSRPSVPGLDFSFSGLKTAFLYFLRDRLKSNPSFIDEEKENLCASLQYTIVELLLDKLDAAVVQTGIREVALAGGVAANSFLRKRITEKGHEKNWKTYLPEKKFTTDNAAMIAVAGYFRFLKGEFTGQGISPSARMPV